MNRINLLRGGDLPVYRTKPLPVAPIRGQFFVTEFVLQATRQALVDTALSGIHDGGHEGMVLWAGREEGEATFFLSAVLPRARHAPQRVTIEEREVARASRAARPHRLGIKAQVHSHPGSDTRHSDGDDDLILMPFEGMLSLVAPRFGIGMDGLESLSVHQYQEGRWVLCEPDSVTDNFTVVPEEIDVR